MRCGKRLGFILLLFLVVSGPLLYSLSEEEVATLPELSTATLIEIILEYDKGMTSLEILIKEQETTLTEQDRLLIAQDDLLVISSELQKKIHKKNDLLKLGLFAGAGLIVVETIFVVANIFRGFR